MNVSSLVGTHVPPFWQGMSVQGSVGVGKYAQKLLIIVSNVKLT